jgi:putrescine transport system permease protein
MHATAPSSTHKPPYFRRTANRAGKFTLIGIPYGFLILFFSLPFLVVLKISLSDTDGVRYVDLLQYAGGVLSIKIRLASYLFLAKDALYLRAYGYSLELALLNTVICLVIGYPFAYFMARSKPTQRPALVMLVSLPFWTSYLLRVYAWKGLLDDQGIVNHVLLWTHLVDHPIKMMYTTFAMTVGMVYTYIAFMILPLYATLVNMDMRLIEASYDLGASPWKTFWLVTVPLSRAGIIAGSMLVFIPSVGEYVIPDLLGGPSTLMIGRVLWDEFFSNNDWSMACAVAVTMVVLILLPLVLFNRVQSDVEQVA